MSLYTQQDSNIRKTWFLMTMFFVVVIAIGWGFSFAFGNSAILYFAVGFSILMNIFSYWYSDKIVLKMAGAKEATRENARELYNIVENLCITSGMSVPKIYVINDPALNAFATGRDPEHAAVAVTSGLMGELNRSELEGVIAHELSHIANRDILISTIIVVLVGFVAILSDFFLRSVFWGRGRRDREGGGWMIVVGIVLAILAPLVTKIIHLAVSRKREFLADASGALLTRYPEGLASALKKISGSNIPLTRQSKAMAHLYISNPLKKGVIIKKTSRLFSTHPPINERISALMGMKTE